MRPDLKGLARFLVDVRGTQHAVLVLDCRQRNGTRDLSSGTLGSLDDLAGRGVQHPVVICLQPNSNSLSYHLFPSFPRPSVSSLSRLIPIFSVRSVKRFSHSHSTLTLVPTR